MKQRTNSAAGASSLLTQAQGAIPAVTRRAKEPKYRPVLTSTQITTILYLAKIYGLPDLKLSAPSMSLISTLAPFEAKIKNAGISPAYVTSPKEPVDTYSLESLGGMDTLSPLPEIEHVVGNIHVSEAATPSGSLPTTNSKLPTAYPPLKDIACYDSKEDYWYSCYLLYSEDPASCSLSQIQAAQEHRFIADLMTPEEEAAYNVIDGNNLGEGL